MSSWQIDLSYLEGEVTGVVTNGDATQTVFSLRHPTKAGFYVVFEGASPIRFHATSQAGGAVFGNQGNVLYAIDKEAGQVLRFPAGVYGGFESLRSHSAESQPMTDPVALALSPDGRSLYVAGGADQIIHEYGLTTGELLREIPLPVAPTRLLPLAKTSFVIDSQRDGAQPVWLVNLLGAPSISFVPAVEVVPPPESTDRMP